MLKFKKTCIETDAMLAPGDTLKRSKVDIEIKKIIIISYFHVRHAPIRSR